MTIKDRLTRGFIAGAGAELIRLALGLGSTALGLKAPQLRYYDFASVLIYGHKPQGFVEAIFAEIAVLGWTGILGILFAYLIPHVSSLNYRFKGALFGITIWFASYATTLLFRVPEFSYINLYTAAANGFFAVIWGVLMAEGLRWLDDKVYDVS